MRKKIIAGNWKMYNDLNESKNLIENIKAGLKEFTPGCEVVICPSYTSLSEASKLIAGSAVKLGAQNLYFEDKGAFTGEISASMLKSAGCEYVIIGHSERRTIFKETDELINKKIAKAVKSGLKPIFCIGETLEEREKGITNQIIERQLREGLKGFTKEDLKDLVIAYEPVWAIGTGKTATPEMAEEVHELIRNYMDKNFSPETADNLVIQYGGSVKPDNAKSLLSQKNIDGALVGGACLEANSFLSIIKAI